MILSARSINDSNFTTILYINEENKTSPLKEFFREIFSQDIFFVFYIRRFTKYCVVDKGLRQN